MTWADGTALSKLERRELARLERKFDPEYEAKQEAKRLAQAKRQEWVDLHKLACFKCGLRNTEWAKGGNENGRLWVICAACVRKPRVA